MMLLKGIMNDVYCSGHTEKNMLKSIEIFIENVISNSRKCKKSITKVDKSGQQNRESKGLKYNIVTQDNTKIAN